jgi:uncharacterized membrane protein
MAMTAQLPMTTFWIGGSLILWVIAVAVGAALYTPSLKRQIQALDAHGFGSAEYRQLSRRATYIGIGNMVPVLLILVLMVFKPTF